MTSPPPIRTHAAGVGKTCLLHRYVEGSFSTFINTIGIDFKTKTVVMDGKTVKVHVVALHTCISNAVYRSLIVLLVVPVCCRYGILLGMSGSVPSPQLIIEDRREYFWSTMSVIGRRSPPLATGYRKLNWSVNSTTFCLL